MVTVLLKVLDEICSIIGKVSTNDLMSVVWQDYSRLQTLMALRYVLELGPLITNVDVLRINFIVCPSVIPAVRLNNFCKCRKSKSMQSAELKLYKMCILPYSQTLVIQFFCKNFFNETTEDFEIKA